MTESQAREYLQQLGLTVPAFMLSGLIEQAQGADECLDAHGVGDGVKLLINGYLLALFAISSGGRRVKSQSAPSGASQSYEYGDLVEQMRSIKAQLRLLDKNGCTTALIPAEPGPTAALMVINPRNAHG